ncbi:MAG: glycoside hydrolase family 88 protein [Gemmiger formicilis]|uniref:glycoside hydrolase family 88 protein n=1 Tax=Gemmiger formicilis TaxID=745368 RepID=UPI00399154B6
MPRQQLVYAGADAFPGKSRLSGHGGTRQFIIDTFRTHAEALCSYQAEDGLFHTVIDDATSYEEASGTAAMAAGLFARHEGRNFGRKLPRLR